MGFSNKPIIVDNDDFTVPVIELCDKQAGTRMTFISNLALAFNHVARNHATCVALRYADNGKEMTYAELATLVDQLADYLHLEGFRQGDVIGIFHDKSPLAFAMMLACLRLGIAYTNLDPESPWERLRKILATCQPNGVFNPFADLSHRAALSADITLRLIEGQTLKLPLVNSSVQLPDAKNVSGSTPAYIMFTSGSTGTPKGAAISHENLLWFIAWARDRFGVTANDVLANVNPMYFDNSVFDFYTALFSGAALVPFTLDQVRKPSRLVHLVNTAYCTFWFSVPSLLIYLLTTHSLTDGDWPTIRKIVFGGEGFPKPKLKQLYDFFGGRADLENVYGPTECTCICSAHKINPDDFLDMQSLATLGSLAQNFSAEILTVEDDNPDFGELVLFGPQVGMGYYNDPERTAQSFIQNPRHRAYIDIGYRTGDLVRRDERGWFHFKGRADFQIKHMGYRVELEEIEAALSTLPRVKECAVIYQKLAEGLGQILGFVARDTPISPMDMIHSLSTILPTYMLPRSIHILDQLPKNANGKIDRQALHKIATERN